MDGWYLPVNQDKEMGVNEVHHKAKYHYFDDSTSLCGKYLMDTGCFETDIESGLIAMNPDLACKKCYKKWIKEFNVLS